MTAVVPKLGRVKCSQVLHQVLMLALPKNQHTELECIENSENRADDTSPTPDRPHPRPYTAKSSALSGIHAAKHTLLPCSIHPQWWPALCVP